MSLEKRRQIGWIVTLTLAIVAMSVWGYAQNLEVDGTTTVDGDAVINGDMIIGGNLSAGGLIPAGTVLAWPTEVAPDGYLECDGTVYQTADYPDLAAALGNMYGGDGATTFGVPSYRGRFLRTWDHGRAIDPNRTTRSARPDGTAGDNVGTTQSHAMTSHSHGFASNRWRPANTSGGGTSHGAASKTAWTGYSGTSENRPKNKYVMFIIKT